jgi:hypothetical protein
LLFVLLERPLALPALALLIGGQVGLGLLLRRDTARAQPALPAAAPCAPMRVNLPPPSILPLAQQSRYGVAARVARWQPADARSVGLRIDAGG